MILDESIHAVKAEFTDIIDRHISGGSIAGAVALIECNGKTLMFDSYGCADQTSQVPMRRDSIFRIASMSKPITSAAMLMLVEEGRVNLDDAISTWLPELANPQALSSDCADLEDTVAFIRPITVRDLLMHRSGIAYSFSAAASLKQALRDATGALDIVPDSSPDIWLGRMAKLPLMYQPGARWHYGHSTDVLGILIARISAMPLADFLQERIFSPLAMKDTGFHVPPSAQQRFTTAYVRTPDADDLQVFDAIGGRWATPPNFQSGGAGLVSTAEDYLAFARMLLRNGEANGSQLLSPSSVSLMTTNALSAEEHTNSFLGIENYWAHRGFGLGLSVIVDAERMPATTSSGQFNWPGAFGTYWFVAPEKNLIGIFLLQEYWSQLSVQDDFQRTAYRLSM